MPKLHAVVSASASKMWMACPRSARLNARLNELLGEESSPYATEGTQAHALAELKLRHANGQLNDVNYEAQLEELKKDIPADQFSEMDRYTNDYVDEVLSRWYAACKDCSDAMLLVEVQLNLTRWIPEGFGTSDAVIIGDNLLEVIDLKYGKGVPVPAEGNSQARLYALGALEEYGDLYGFHNIRYTIVQPRINSVSDETLSRDDLLRWGEGVKLLAEKAYKGEGEFHAGEHCRFCRARGICKERAMQAMDLTKYGLQDPDLLDENSLSAILQVADVAEAWLKDVKDYAYRLAMKGQKISGYKLVAGKKPGRQWTNEADVVVTLAQAGYMKEQFYEQPALLSPSKLQKAIGAQAYKALVDRYTTQGEAKLTLVPESDKREAVDSADRAFADMKDN